MTEIWKDIPGYKHECQASTNGQIRSLGRKIWYGSGYRSTQNKILISNKTWSGHAYDYRGIQTDFAKLYQVHPTTINNIAVGKCYNHVK